MKRILTLLFVCSIAFANSNTSSYEDYTYQSDKSFNNIQKLVGKTFIPNAYTVGVGIKEHVEPGAVKIHIGNDFIAMDGVEDLYYFNIVDKKKTNVGFEFRLAGMRGSDFSKFKVVTDGANHVQLLYFSSRKHGEHTFHLPKKSNEQIAKENQYFTPKNRTLITSYDALQNQFIIPNRKIENTKNPLAVAEAISMKRGFEMKFGAKTMTINSKATSEQFTYTVKKVKTEEVCCEKTYGGAVKMMKVRVKNKAKNIKVYLNAVNQIEYIDIKNTRYFLR